MRGGWAGTGLQPKHARAQGQCAASSPTAQAQPRPEVGTGPGPAAPPCPQEPLGSAPGHCEPGPGPAPTPSPPSRKAGGRWRGCPASRAPPGSHSSPAALQPCLTSPDAGVRRPGPEHHGDTVPGRSPRLCNQPSFTMATSVMVPGVLTLRSPRVSPSPAVPTASGGSEGQCEAVSSWGHSSDPAASPGGPSHPGPRPGPTFLCGCPAGPSGPLLPAVSAPHPRPQHATCSLGLGPPTLPDPRP